MQTNPREDAWIIFCISVAVLLVLLGGVFIGAWADELPPNTSMTDGPSEHNCPEGFVSTGDKNSPCHDTASGPDDNAEEIDIGTNLMIEKTADGCITEREIDVDGNVVREDHTCPALDAAGVVAPALPDELPATGTGLLGIIGISAALLILLGLIGLKVTDS